MITVDELMTPKPHTLRADDCIGDAWKLMTEKHIRHIPITDESGQLQGLVTQRDVLAAVGPSSMRQDGKLDSDIVLEDIMIRNVTTVHQSDHLRQAALHMQSHRHGCLPVMADDRLVGIITDTDFVTIAINLLEQVELLEEQVDPDVLMDDDLDIPVASDDEWN